MASTLTANMAIQLSATENDAIDLQTIRAALAYSKSKALANGTGNNQANVLWSDQRTIAASGTEDLDLAGVLVNAAGKVVTFTKIKAILIVAAAANVNNVVVTRPASNGVPLFVAAGDGIAVQPDGKFYAEAPNAGYVVTAATGDLLTVTNSGAGTPVTYDVVIIGVGTLA